MKTIYLVRHGKAVSRECDIADFERTLIERGENDVLQVAKRLKTKLKPKTIEISSSNLFGHEMLNVVPSYENEDPQEKHLAKPEELEELQKILVKTQKLIKKTPKPKKIKLDTKKPEKKMWLPRRIP